MTTLVEACSVPCLSLPHYNEPHRPSLMGLNNSLQELLLRLWRCGTREEPKTSIAEFSRAYYATPPTTMAAKPSSSLLAVTLTVTPLLALNAMRTIAATLPPLTDLP